MALATEDDMAVLLGRPLTQVELAKVPGALRRASNLVAGYCNRLFTAPVPEPVRDVTAGIALRDILSPGEFDSGEGNKQYTMGPFQVSAAAAGAGSRVWISDADRITLRPYVTGVNSIDMRSEHYFPPVLEGS